MKIKPVLYFIAVFRRTFYDKHFDIQLMALGVKAFSMIFTTQQQ